MTPAARVQAAIELLDQIIDAAKGNGPPADRLIADYFRRRRYAGSKDRRAVREMVYAAVRGCGPVPANGRAAMLKFAEHDTGIRSLFDGSTHGPEPIGNETPAQGGIAPEWLEKALAGSDIAGEEAAALLDRAPLDLRDNALAHANEALELPEKPSGTPAPNGLRFPAGTPVEQWDAYRAGHVEIQDAGSQLACLTVGAQPGETVIDLCAGAGGKTLALAAAMDNRGTLLATDTDRRRLGQLAPRAERSRAGMIETRLLDPGKELAMLSDFAGRADAVLVDAPCSGTGTWRRNPEARWRIDPKQLERYVSAQARLLDIATGLAAPDGRIVFVTCSLLDAEGADQVEAFLARHPGWRAEPIDMPAGRTRGQGIRLTPFHDGTDGFFIARLSRAC